MIPYGRQSISQQDIDAVVEVLQSDFLTQGEKVPAFERAVADYCGAEYAFAVNSATSGLHVACLALGLDSGDYLWTTPISFVASANCGLYCGAQVDFVDIDPKTYNICIDSLARKLEFSAQRGCLPKVLVAVHLCGQPCDMEAIYALSQRYGFFVIEDASHAIGARYKDSLVGSCSFSDITVFSFHPVKIITTAEGGMVLTNKECLAEKMVLFRSHGVTRDPGLMVSESEGPWYYQQVELGFNYRMTELQAALGLSQLTRLDSFVKNRNELAARYDQELQSLPLMLPWQHPDVSSAWHLYVIRLQLELIGFTHRQVFEALRSEGIGVNLHYIPIYKQPYYRELKLGNADFPCAESYYQEAISIPLYHDMTRLEQDKVIEVLRMVLK